MKGEGSKNGSERAEDMFPLPSRYQRALVMEGGRMRESGTRSTGVTVLEGMGTKGSLLDIGERKKRRMEREQGVVGTEFPTPVFYSLLTLRQNMVHFDSLGAHTHMCVIYSVSPEPYPIETEWRSPSHILQGSSQAWLPSRWLCVQHRALLSHYHT